MEFDTVGNENSSEGNLNQLIAQLTVQKEQLATEGRYLEAEEIKTRINELKGNLTGQKKKDLDYQHATEMQNLEENYNKDLFEFNQSWDLRFNEFNERAHKLEEVLNQRHKNEMENHIANLDNKLPKQVKFSKEYLDLKQSEYNLVKQERYIEAHFIKSKCEVLEKIENDKWDKERNEKMRLNTEKLTNKQNLEKNALKQKLDYEYDILKKQKEEEMAKIILKYKNRKSDLEFQQRQEKILQENENLLKAKNASLRYSQTQTLKSFNKSTNFKVSLPELRMKEVKKAYDTNKTNKTISQNSTNNNLKYYQQPNFNDTSTGIQKNGYQLDYPSQNYQKENNTSHKDIKINESDHADPNEDEQNIYHSGDNQDTEGYYRKEENNEYQNEDN